MFRTVLLIIPLSWSFFGIAGGYNSGKGFAGIAPPEVDLGPDQEVCEGETVLLDATVTDAGATYLWQDGSTSPTLLVTQTGEYSVTVTAAGESASDTVNVTVFDVPDLDLGNDTTLCLGDSLVFDLSDINVQVVWPDGSIGSRYVAYNTQLVRVELDTRDGCTVSDEVQATFVDPPVVDLGPDVEICDGGGATLDATVPGNLVSYAWNDGNDQAVRTVTESGSYAVTVSQGGCSSSDAILVSIGDGALSVDLGPADTVVCGASSITFDLSDITGTITWSDGSTGPIYTATTSEIVQVEVIQGGCTATDAIRVDFGEPINLDLGPPSISLCQDEPYTLQTQDPNASYFWSDGSTGNSLTIQQSGTYWVRAELDGCTASDTIAVELTPVPETNLDGVIDGCEGVPVTLDAGNPDAEIVWQDGTTGPLFTVSESGSYWVNIRDGACDVRDTVTISFNPTPDVEFEAAEIRECTGETVTLEPFVSLTDQVTWQDGSTGATLNVNRSGIYWAEAEFEGCSNRDSVRVTFLDAPEVNLGDDRTACNNEAIFLEAGSGNDNVLWSTGFSGNTLFVDSEGTYSVIVDNGTCSASDTVTVSFLACGTENIFVPSAFSPNGDDVNDQFKPYISPAYQVSDYELLIFDRWGGLIFQTADIDAYWDGTFNGQEVQVGVYVYMVKIKFTDGAGEQDEILSGDVAIIR